jgi:polyisoprenoid-binding protein YceI
MARCAVLTPLVIFMLAAFTDAQTFQVDAARSRATIHVGKAGMFSFVAGHTHEVSGPIHSGSIDVDLDTPSRSRVRLAIATAALKVSAEQEPEGDAPKVQETMDSDKVLDVAHHPQITFESTSVTVTHRDGSRLDLTVTGQLTIRDVRREVTAPVHVELTGNAATCTGRFAIKQSSFGIKPISIAGVVAVKDALDIYFSVTAHQ